MVNQDDVQAMQTIEDYSHAMKTALAGFPVRHTNEAACSASSVRTTELDVEHEPYLLTPRTVGQRCALGCAMCGVHVPRQPTGG